jgi:hypothetical protein
MAHLDAQATPVYDTPAVYVICVGHVWWSLVPHRINLAAIPHLESLSGMAALLVWACRDVVYPPTQDVGSLVIWTPVVSVLSERAVYPDRPHAHPRQPLVLVV